MRPTTRPTDPCIDDLLALLKELAVPGADFAEVVARLQRWRSDRPAR